MGEVGEGEVEVEMSMAEQEKHEIVMKQQYSPSLIIAFRITRTLVTK